MMNYCLLAFIYWLTLKSIIQALLEHFAKWFEMNEARKQKEFLLTDVIWTYSELFSNDFNIIVSILNIWWAVILPWLPQLPHYVPVYLLSGQLQLQIEEPIQQANTCSSWSSSALIALVCSIPWTVFNHQVQFRLKYPSFLL